MRNTTLLTYIDQPITNPITILSATISHDEPTKSLLSTPLHYPPTFKRVHPLSGTRLGTYSGDLGMSL